MEKRFLKFLLFGVFTLVFSIAFVGCGDDYDDAGLNTKIDQLQKAYDDLKSAAITSDKLDASVSTAVSTAKTELEGKMKDLIAAQMTNGGTEADLAALTEILAQLKVLADYFPDTRYAGAMAAVEEAAGDAAVRADKTPAWVQAILDCTTAVKRLDLQMAVLKMKDNGEGGYTSDVITGIEAEMARLNGLIGTGGELNEAALVAMINNYLTEHYKTTIEKIAAEIKSISPESLIIVKNIDKMITGIALVETTKDAGYGVTFGSTTVLRAGTFGKDYENPIEFKKDASMSGTQSVVVRVTPANAVLTKEMISLVNSKGEDNIGTYVKVKSVDKYAGSITRATLPSTGLYEIFFEFDATKADFANVAGNGTTTPLNAFSVAVETGTDRHVLTDFAVTFETSGGTDPVYASSIDVFQFEVNGTKVANIKANALDKVWTGSDYTNNANTADLPSPDRSANTFNNLLVKVNEPIKVKMDLTAKDANNKELANAYAYYIGFDGSNPSWKLANVSGMNRVYLIGETAELTITDVSLKGYPVSFRVYAVNYDGTYVDPDGKAFNVICDNDASGEPLAFATEITGYVADNDTVSTQAVDVPYLTNANGKNFRYELSISIEGKIYTNSTDLSLDVSAPTSNKVGTAVIGGILPAGMKEDTEYSGTLILRDKTTLLQLASYAITLKKTLPSNAPPLKLENGISSASEDGSYMIVDKVNKEITIIPGISGTANTEKNSSVLTQMSYKNNAAQMNAYIGQNIGLSLSGAGFSTKDGVTTITSGFVSTPSAQLEYNYGKIKFGGGEHKVAVSEDYSVEVKSFFAGYSMDFKNVGDISITIGSGLTVALELTCKPFATTGAIIGTNGIFRKAEFDQYVNLVNSKGTVTTDTGTTDLTIGKYDQDGNLQIELKAAALSGLDLTLPATGTSKTLRIFGLNLELHDKLGGVNKISQNVTLKMDEHGSITLE